METPIAMGETLYQSCSDVAEGIKIQHPTKEDFYQYRSLPSTDMVRFIILEPSSDPKFRISCRMFHSPIQTALHYEALSYTWGTDKATAPILIDGQVYHVRYNLFQSLNHLRPSTQERVLWIDALCIDQSNVAERGSQVSHMTQIYSGADRVLVWLDKGDQYTHRAMDWLEEITPQAIILKQIATDRQQLYNDWVDLFSSLHDRKDSEDVLRGIMVLLLAPWWTRVWTLQEIALAREARVQVGRRDIPWECFEYASMLCTAHTVHTHRQRPERWSANYRALQFDLTKLLVQADTIRVIRRKWRDDETPLSLMVGYTKARYATDPRDKIYGVLGLISTGQKPVADYRLSCAEVYIEAFKMMLGSFRDLRVYNYLQHGLGLSGPRRIEGLPSWVPDFVTPKTDSLQELCFIDGALETDPVSSQATGLIYFTASLRHEKLIRSRIGFDDRNSRLILKGIPIDEIHAIGDRARDESYWAPGETKTGQAYHTAITQWRSMLNWRKPEYVAGGSQKEAYWRTVLLDSKVIGYHTEISLRNNPRDQRLRLDKADTSIPPPDQASEKRLFEALDKQVDCSEDRQRSMCFFVTEKGYMGMAMPMSQKGDIVCVLFGGEVPYILRPVGDDTYKMVGQCYLHGIMDGEAIQDAARGHHIIQDFNIC